MILDPVRLAVEISQHSMLCSACTGHLENNSALEKLLPCIWEQVNFLSTKEGLTEIRDMLLTNMVPTVVHTGVIAPMCSHCASPKHWCGAPKTSFLQLLGLASNISIGNIEILSDTLLIKIETVGTSETELVRTPSPSS